MNEPAAHLENRPGGRRRWLVLVVSLPIVLGAIAVALLAFGEYRSARAVRSEIARLRAAGEPVDDESLARWFHANTSQEGTAEWREILVAVGQVSGGAGRSLPIMGPRALLPEDLAPGAEWPDEPHVAAFLQEVRPLIEQIEQAARYPTPVWQPIAFDSFGTLLDEVQEMRGIMRLLQLEFTHAMYHQENERALSALTAMHATNAALGWDFSFLPDLIAIAMRNIHRHTIRQSLADTAWEADQLDRLLAQVAHPHVGATRWQRAVAGERAMALSLLRGDRQRRDTMLQQERAPVPAPLLLFPSLTQDYLERMAAMQQIGAEGVLELGARAEAFDEEIERSVRRSDLLTGLLLPSARGMARAYERDELDRRLTRTALAIKRYQRAEGHWPAQLSDLAAVGLQAADWNALHAGPFGYRVDADGALVWSYDLFAHDAHAVVPKEPPSDHATATSAKIAYIITRIR
jgi:hypothetical protein